jgi:hypothetical protein
MRAAVGDCGTNRRRDEPLQGLAGPRPVCSSRHRIVGILGRQRKQNSTMKNPTRSCKAILECWRPACWPDPTDSDFGGCSSGIPSACRAGTEIGSVGHNLFRRRVAGSCKTGHGGLGLWVPDASFHTRARFSPASKNDSAQMSRDVHECVRLCPLQKMDPESRSMP